MGTGFFVSTNGLLVTAATVVAGADRCWIEYGGRRLAARPRGLDRRANLAVLAVDPAGCVPEGQPLPHLPLTGGSTPPAIGSFVVAVGFAYDLPCAPSVGVVQGLDLVHGTNVLVTSHLRADCRLKPGQAGAPLLGTDGQVVGIAVAARGEDQCYALPAAAARRVVDDLVDHGATQYSWVGLEVVERRPPPAAAEVRRPLLLVQGVCSNSPAALAGFQPQDQLVQIQRRPVRGLADVMDTVFHHHAGDELEFTVRRDGALHELRVVLGAVPSLPLAERPAPSLRLTPVDASR
ncbi:serine protease [bacterium]|nr:serine protease [bacterium]